MSRFQTEFQIEGGPTFLGVMTTPNFQEAPSIVFTLARRILQVPPGSPVQARHVILHPYGQRFLVGAPGAADWQQQTIYRVHRLFETTDQLSWSRMQIVNDILTGLPKGTTPADKGLIWCTVEPLRQEDIDRQVHIRQERLLCITNVMLQLGDRVGDREVKRVNPQLGLTFAELQ